MSKFFIPWTLLLLFTAVGFWYFIFKPYDFSISFQIEEIPGETYQKVLNYRFEVLENVETLEVKPFKSIVQQANLEDYPLTLIWEFNWLEEGSSLVVVKVDTKNSFYTRWQLLTGKNDLQEKVSSEIKNFFMALQNTRDLYRVEITGIMTYEAATCACIPLKNEVNGKASNMMRTIGTLSDFILKNNLEMTARPRVYVHDWNLESNFIQYEFCFPIHKDSIPVKTPGIKIKNFPMGSALHASYNGNYMFSHLAWVKLLHYARENNLNVEKQPLEIFNDNPEMGGDSRNWRADIYMPLK